jgi:metallo-beta-lactamase class B
MRALFLGLVAAVGVLLMSVGQAADHPANWSRPTAPFRIVGNVYYVGTEGLSAYLVTGPSGHVLIDGALPSSAPLIAQSIARLGFKPRDVKYLLINHSHFDHAGGLGALKRLTGAQLISSAGEKADLEAGRTLGRPELEGFPAVKVDRVIGDGDQVRLGPVVLTAILTPGHTTGATSWTTMAGGKRVIFASSITVAGQRLAGNPAYPTAAADFRRTFAKLRNTRADVFLNFHAEGFGMEAKRARQLAGEADAFVDPGELARQVDAAERGFEIELASQTAAAKGG